MLRHIPRSRDNQKNMRVEFPKIVTDLIPLSYFCAYFQKTVFGLNKLLGVDGSMDASPALYVLALDIHDPHTLVCILNDLVYLY